MTYDPVARLEELRCKDWLLPYPVPESHDLFRGNFTERHALNVPGPFYGAETDTCCCGPLEAPASVLFDDQGIEFVWRQPRDDNETFALTQAADSDPFRGYGFDGDQHWTTELVRYWWRDRAERVPAVAAAAAAPGVMAHDELNARVARVFATWLDYLEGPEIMQDLRRYLYRLEVGRYPTQGQTLPEL